MNVPRHRGFFGVAGVVLLVGIGVLLYTAVNRKTPAHLPALQLPKVLQCSGATASRPRNYVLSCADANSELEMIHWSSWTVRHATAHGRYAFNDCTPYCAAGRWVSYPATIRFTAPLSTHAGSLFGEVTIEYVDASGKRTTTKESLPTTPLGSSTMTTSARG